MDYMEMQYKRISRLFRELIKGMGVNKWHELSDILMIVFVEQYNYEDKWDWLRMQASVSRETFDLVHPSQWCIELTMQEWINETGIDVSESTMLKHLNKLSALGLVQKRIDYNGVLQIRCNLDNLFKSIGVRRQ